MEVLFNKNEDHHKLLCSELRTRYARVKKGGGKARLDRQHAEGKWSARERIDYLLDQPKEALEIGAFAGDGMYGEHGGCPSGGVIVKVGRIQGRLCVVVANDATVKAGAWFP
ncbi:MAG TPA: carboxyl transferase domain-containing protein, partial [Robiginitalea sp.]|nr:carboxyl transferase domain-containing protein [Robiginitalea sp.]